MATPPQADAQMRDTTIASTHERAQGLAHGWRGEELDLERLPPAHRLVRAATNGRRRAGTGRGGS
ncbi:hypothetical protein [Nocardiopsis kunsanensis]|uniref:hypothetical protein n=1 Tax=Nocardiopsis kunsanensis TaxID=141693 RepID=UPI0003484E6D|nr:hypothetical protein [Nocardiopsis kunsanensis]